MTCDILLDIPITYYRQEEEKCLLPNNSIYIVISSVHLCIVQHVITIRHPATLLLHHRYKSTNTCNILGDGILL